ncbi:MAG: hypothetical protein J7484_11485 [Microbacterium sp.]|nr:hypothetical protein [Microbacterium sp.]
MTPLLRTRRAVWGDVRFLLGIALIALSIGGVWLLVSSSSRTTPILQAARTIVVGRPLDAADFRVVDVGLGSVTDDYLGPQDLRPGVVAGRTLQDGELVPRSAAADADVDRTTTVVIESSTGIPVGVRPGSVVDLWYAPPLDDGRAHEAPRILVAGAIVSTVIEPEGMLAGDGVSVEVVVDRADVGTVLAALTGEALLSVVPVGATP